MKTSTSVVDRLILLVAAAAALAYATWAITTYFRHPLHEDIARVARTAEWPKLPDMDWWLGALVLGTVISALLGLFLLVANLRTHGLNAVRSPLTSSRGKITLQLGKIAKAMADDLSGIKHVRRVSHRLFNDNGIPTLELTVTADASASLADITQQLRTTEADLRAATPGIEFASRYKVHVS